MVTLTLGFFCFNADWSSAQESRVALVVGNAGYTNAGPLLNPINDATDLGEVLTRLGFQVTVVRDVSTSQFRDAIRSFGEAAVKSDLALFYFAGHGIQVAGKNYLLPIDANLKTESDIEFETIELDVVIDQMRQAAKARIVLLDACRDNPFASRLSQSMSRSRSTNRLGRGLKRVYSDEGVFIAFATEPDEVAADGLGRNSPFASALLNYIEDPTLEINSLMTRVRADVFDQTGQMQRPWSNSSLLVDVFLAPAKVKQVSDFNQTVPDRKSDDVGTDVVTTMQDLPQTNVISDEPAGLSNNNSKLTAVPDSRETKSGLALEQMFGGDHAELRTKIASYSKLDEIALLPGEISAENIEINSASVLKIENETAVTELNFNVRNTWGRTLMADHFFWKYKEGEWLLSNHGIQP